MTEMALNLRGKKLSAKDRLIVALDVSTLAEAEAWMEKLAGEVGMFKVGLELFTSCGTALFDLVKKHGVKLFFDGKFHDIPNTVSGATKAAVKNGCDMFNIHALGGRQMMETAARTCQETADSLKLVQRPALIAVTILTSTSAESLKADLQIEKPLEKMVPYLAKMAQECGLDGVVASAQEAGRIREVVGKDFLIVTPGIRPASAAKDDQARIVTPGDAIKSGADYIVVGRPILKADDPVDAARKIVQELGSI
jgi:orotidine-5''-phosphate decarboxylase (EC 4.1.1.23)